MAVSLLASGFSAAPPVPASDVGLAPPVPASHVGAEPPVPPPSPKNRDAARPRRIRRCPRGWTRSYLRRPRSAARPLRWSDNETRVMADHDCKFTASRRQGSAPVAGLRQLGPAGLRHRCRDGVCAGDVGRGGSPTRDAPVNRCVADRGRRRCSRARTASPTRVPVGRHRVDRGKMRYKPETLRRWVPRRAGRGYRPGADEWASAPGSDQRLASATRS